MKGNLKALAGNVMGIAGFGRYDDNFVINTSAHSVSRGGHTTSVETAVAKK